MKHSLFALLLGLLPGLAWAATLTLPSVTITSPVSTAIVCTSAPIDALGGYSGTPGTVIASCVVTPATFSGVASITGTQFKITGLNGNVFNVVVGPVALNPGTYSPGLVTTLP